MAPWTGEDSGGADNHNRAGAVFLSGAHPVKGNTRHLWPQHRPVRAQRRSAKTRRYPRSSSRSSRVGLNCDSGNTCAYINTLAWKSATLPLPMEHNPQVAFERCSAAASPKPSVRRGATEASSVLDSVLGQSAGCRDVAGVRSAGVHRLSRGSPRGRATRRAGRLAHVAWRGAARAARRHPRRSGRARELDVRFAGAGVQDRDHAHLDVHVWAGAQQHDLSEQRRPGVLAPGVAPLERPQEHGSVRGAQPLPRGSARRLPREATRHARRRRHAARSLDDPLRQQPERRQPAQLLAVTGAAGRRRLGPTSRAVAISRSRRTRRCRTCCWRCCTRSARRSTASATARSRWRFNAPSRVISRPRPRRQPRRGERQARESVSQLLGTEGSGC